MSNKDTLPPGHFEPMTAMQVAGFKTKAYALANSYACASTREHTDAARLELLEEIGRLTAIAAQAPTDLAEKPTFFVGELPAQEPLHPTVLIDWLAARYRAAGGKEGITDLSAFCEEVMRWTETKHGITGAAK